MQTDGYQPRAQGVTVWGAYLLKWLQQMKHFKSRDRFYTDNVCTEALSTEYHGSENIFEVRFCKQHDNEDFDSVSAQFVKDSAIDCITPLLDSM